MLPASRVIITGHAGVLVGGNWDSLCDIAGSLPCVIISNSIDGKERSSTVNYEDQSIDCFRKLWY